MKIGIIGLGVVGNALKNGFELLGHELFLHDIKFKNTKIEDLKDTNIIYVCVDTPGDSNGKCNISGITLVCNELDTIEYKGIGALKSTIEPGSTKNISENSKLNICFIPEFLREKSASKDFIENHEILIVGTNCKSTYETIKKSHGNLPKESMMVSATEAELIKYYSNAYKAMKVVFSNAFYEIANKLNADYTNIIDGFLKHKVSQEDYTTVNDSFRGYGGMCLPKDVKAIDNFCKQINLDMKIFETIDNDNKLYKTTVPKGMRL